jgi:hypothetical protein
LSAKVLELCLATVAIAGSLHAEPSSAFASTTSSVCETAIPSKPLKADSPGKFEARFE